MAVKREMSNIESKCINPGCSWKGTFKQYEVSTPFSLCLNFFHLHVLARKPNYFFFLFIQTNSFIIFTCPNPVLLCPRLLGKVGYHEDCPRTAF